ncbi:BspA family leucine-rich repeat surface protein [Levilactobacillus yonginensis]|uniref:BspA family leucine-rich repeat surface protein n=1 Tax=Levilactobacillus yonginensis TaxID=1054041 RepID=UPI00345CFC37
MTKKLRNTTKTRLTTLAIMGAIAGVGVQANTAYADTNESATNSDNQISDSAANTANYTTKQSATLTSSQPKLTDKGSTQTPVTKPTSDTASKAVIQAADKPAATPAQPADTTGKLTPKPVAPVTTATPKKVISEEQPTPKVAQGYRGTMARAMAPVAPASLADTAATAAPTIVKTGMSGTSKWTMDSDGVMTFYAGTLANIGRYHSATKVVFDGSQGKVVLPANSMMLFWDWENVTAFEGMENVDASQVKNMTQMFSQDFALKSLDLSSWDLSNVTDMTGAFSGRYYDPETDTHYKMGLVDLKLGTTTSNVTTMDSMLYNDDALTTVDAADWDVSSLTSADSLFYGTAIANLNLSGWQTSKLKTLSNAFASMPNLVSFDGSNWDTSNVVIFVQAFEGDPLLTTAKVSDWDVSGGSQFTSMFHNDPSLATLDLSQWHPTINYMIRMFAGDTALTKLDLSGFNLAAVDGDHVNEALADTTGLQELVLGTNTRLGDTTTGNALLPDIPVTDVYTGLWQAVGTGTVDKPNGATFTSAQLNTAYDGSTMADTYVWQKVATPTEPDTNPSGGSNTGTPTEPITPTPTPEPGTNANEDDKASGGSGANVGGTTTKKATSKTPVKRTKTSQPKVVTSGSADKMSNRTVGQVATVNGSVAAKVGHGTQQPGQQLAAQPKSSSTAMQQQSATTLPQTNEQKSSWVAVLAGFLGLSLLSIHWFKRQD